MKIQTRLVQISPYYMFCRQVADNMESIRAENSQAEFLPLQFGGLFGQVAVLNEKEVMEITEVDGGERKNTTKVRSLTRSE